MFRSNGRTNYVISELVLDYERKWARPIAIHYTQLGLNRLPLLRSAKLDALLDNVRRKLVLRKGSNIFGDQFDHFVPIFRLAMFDDVLRNVISKCIGDEKISVRMDFGHRRALLGV